MVPGANAKDDKAANPVVVMKTNMGTIHIELYPEKAPTSVKNFLWYVNNNFYDNLIFHRIIPDFMIQGGGFTKDMKKKEPNAPIKNEADNGLKNEKYTVAMARTSVINSATSQFFINLKDNSFLNFKNKTPQGYGYAVFGKVIKGMEVVDEMAGVKTTSKMGHDDVPVKPVIIEKTYVLGKEKKK
jgi:peptidyl-prolyl cis-trans isomerase B (cyclophilin B)